MKIRVESKTVDPVYRKPIIVQVSKTVAPGTGTKIKVESKTVDPGTQND